MPLTGAEIPKIGKRGCRSQKTPEKGVPSPKIPIFLVVLSALYRKWGFFDSEHPFLGGGGKWEEFLTRKPSFPDFGDFGPCRGKRSPNSRSFQRGWCRRGDRSEPLTCVLRELQFAFLMWGKNEENEEKQKSGVGKTLPGPVSLSAENSLINLVRRHLAN